MAKATSFEPDIAETVIAHSVEVRGNIECSNDLWIDGNVHGSVKAEGTVTLGINAQVFGDINALNLNMSGQVKGNVYIREKLLLGQSGRLIGDVKTGSLGVTEGAVLIGQISMPDDHPAQDDTKPDEDTTQV